MQNDPLVSVLMNCYNGEKYLSSSIKSLLNQTYKNWELIFWDNQSTDSSKKIIKNFKDTRIKYFYSTTHEILYQARNLALSHAKGPYIAFLDTDDTWEKNKLELQLSLFKRDKDLAAVYGNMWNHYNFLINFKRIYKKQKLPEGFIFDKLALEYSVGLTTVVLKKESLQDYPNIFDVNYNMLADFYFILKFSKKFKFGCIQKPIASYRIHRENMSKKYLGEQVHQFRKWLDYTSRTNFFNSRIQIKFMNDHLNYLELKHIIKKSNFLFSFNKIIKYPDFFKKIKLFIFLIFRKYLF